jgi:sulfur-carrier protein
MARVTVLWFAHLREQRGADSDEVESAATTVRELYRELCQRYRLDFPERSLVVAINEEVVTWDAALADRDTVVFLPPVSGG